MVLIDYSIMTSFISNLQNKHHNNQWRAVFIKYVYGVQESNIMCTGVQVRKN